MDSEIHESILSPSNKLTWLDFLVIGLYFILILTVGLYSSYRSKRSSIQGYFLAGRNMHWIPVGASLFASNIGSGHFIGLAGSGATSGIGIAAYELSAVFTLMILGWIFVPVYMAAEVYTMPEYMQLRYGGQRIRVYLAVLALFIYVFTKISADLYAGALFIQLALGLEGDEGLYASIFVLLAFSAVFTIAGGLTAVIWTDFVQTILMLIGASILMVLSFTAVGGYQELIRKFLTESEPTVSISGAIFRTDLSTNRTCGAVTEDAMHLIRSPHAGADDHPWTGLLFGLPFTSMWYFCSDQVIVQRALASKDLTHAKAGCLLAGLLKLTPLFLLVFPGMAARVLYTNRVACSDPQTCLYVCGSTTGCTNIAYAELVIRLMPKGLSGLMLAVMMAALMSSLTSIFNSSSTIFTIDIWTRLRKKASDRELLLVGRVSILFLLVISVLWVPVLKGLKASQLFVYIQQVQMFLSPPITSIYLLGLFVPRVNELGAFCGLMVGLVLGITRFVLEFTYVSPHCGSVENDTRPNWIKIYVGNVHYLHYAGVLFLITSIVSISTSFLSMPIDKGKLERLTFWTRYSVKVRQPMKRIFNPRVSADTEPSSNREFSNLCNEAQRFNQLAIIGSSMLSTEAEKAGIFIKESTFSKTTVNLCAIGVAGASISLWIYYA